VFVCSRVYQQASFSAAFDATLKLGRLDLPSTRRVALALLTLFSMNLDICRVKSNFKWPSLEDTSHSTLFVTHKVGHKPFTTAILKVNSTLCV